MKPAVNPFESAETTQSLMLRATGSPQVAGAFVDSMPERYRTSYDADAILEHAAIASRRGDAHAHVELWRRQPDGVSVLAVVADDRPGLLSLISASVVIQKLDIVSALAFTRKLPGKLEAFDLLWLRRESPNASPVGDADAERIAEVLGEMISGALPIEAAMERARPPRVVPAGSSTNVTFDDAPSGQVVLTVETFDRPGLLLAITLALYRARVQISTTEALTKGTRVVDRFAILELDGSPVSKERRGAVQVEVLEAIHAIARGRA
jgi:[protein-PII] uridylyltransferase